MRISPDKYPSLADMYMRVCLGEKCPGLIHNMNNYVHILDMRYALLKNKVDSNSQAIYSSFFQEMSRCSQGLTELVSALRKNSEYTFYAQKDPVQLRLRDYMDWWLEFWRNDLFFKHNIRCDPEVEASDIHIQLVPFYLTLCLEQGLKNQLEAYKQKDPRGEYSLGMSADSDQDQVRFKISGKSELLDADPWEEGTTTKQGHLGMGLPVVEYIARSMNWRTSLESKAGETVFQLDVPRKS